MSICIFDCTASFIKSVHYVSMHLYNQSTHVTNSITSSSWHQSINYIFLQDATFDFSVLLTVCSSWLTASIYLPVVNLHSSWKWVRFTMRGTAGIRLQASHRFLDSYEAIMFHVQQTRTPAIAEEEIDRGTRGKERVRPERRNIIVRGETAGVLVMTPGGDAWWKSCLHTVVGILCISLLLPW